MERHTAALQGSSGSTANTVTRKTLRVGVIGLGIGEQHALAYQKHPQCKITKLCDRSKEKLQDIQKRFPDMALTTSANEVLEDPDIDLVSIASFDDAHYEMIMKALDHGKHVFVEKPLCQNREQLNALNQAWKRHNGRLKMISNLLLRAAPLYRWLKTQIEAGVLGDIYAFDAEYLYGRIEKITEGWRSRVDNYSAMEGGGVHMVDLLVWLTGQRPEQVTMWGNRIATQNTAFRYNDYMASTLNFKSGLIARVTANFGCVHRHQHVVRLFGTKGTFLYDDAGARLHTSRDPSVPATPVSHAPKPATKGELIAGFVDAILKDVSMDSETQSHFDVMSILIASDQSMADRQTKEIAYL